MHESNNQRFSPRSLFASFILSPPDSKVSEAESNRPIASVGGPWTHLAASAPLHSKPGSSSTPQRRCSCSSAARYVSESLFKLNTIKMEIRRHPSAGINLPVCATRDQLGSQAQITFPICYPITESVPSPLKTCAGKTR